MRAAALLGVLLAVYPLAAHAASPAARAGRAAPARLEAAAIAAVRRDERVAVVALWQDRVPVSAARTLAGPALVALRAAAAGRRAARIRVRMLRSRLRIVSVRLSRGGGSAEVVARWRETLRPASLDGASSGPPLALDEEAALFLRWRPGSGRFVVSRVELVR